MLRRELQGEIRREVHRKREPSKVGHVNRLRVPVSDEAVTELDHYPLIHVHLCRNISKYKVRSVNEWVYLGWNRFKYMCERSEWCTYEGCIVVGIYK